MTPRLSNATADRDAEIMINSPHPGPATASRPYPSSWQRLDDTEGTTDRTDDHGEPDVIVWGRDDDAISPRNLDRSHLLLRPPALRQLRQFAGPLLLMAGFIAAIMATQQADDRIAPERVGPSSDGPAASAQAPHVRPRLIAPAIATPGQRIVVLAFKNAGLCSRAELRFDGTPVQHRLTGIAGSQLPDRVEIFLGVQLPRSATVGMHTLDLYGSTVSGWTGSTCAHLGDQQAKLATTIIAVAGPGGDPGSASAVRNDRAPEDHDAVPSRGTGYAPSSVNIPVHPVWS
jgi:hypothetical protein